ncbi:MAG: hypothetical protein Q9187_007835, partial [Circinaria calcarea]
MKLFYVFSLLLLLPLDFGLAAPPSKKSSSSSSSRKSSLSSPPVPQLPAIPPIPASPKKDPVVAAPAKQPQSISKEQKPSNHQSAGSTKAPANNTPPKVGGEGDGRRTRAKAKQQQQKGSDQKPAQGRPVKPKLTLDTSGNYKKDPSPGGSPRKGDQGKSPISPKTPTTPGAPPRIIDTTRGSDYERLWPKPGEKSRDSKSSYPTQEGPSTPPKKKDKEAATKKKQDEARQKKIKGLLKEPGHKPQRPDANWVPPSPDAKPGLEKAKAQKGKPKYHLPGEDKKAGKTPYHPIEKSSGVITAPDRKQQYSGQSGSPRNDPGFLQYTNNKDPYDRSYVRKEKFKEKDGKEKVAGVSVYDGLNMPYHAANKLNNLKKNPDYTYAQVVKGGKGKKDNRKVTDKVKQTYDPARENSKKKPLANPKDESPQAATYVKDKGEERMAKTNVAPVPDRESRGKLPIILSSTDRQAQKLADKAKQKKVWTGTAIMDGDRLKYDYKNGKKGPYNLPSPPGSP